MINNHFKLRVGFLVLLIMVIPSPIIGLILWFHSLIVNGLFFYLTLPLVIVFSLFAYLLLTICLSIIFYKTGPQLREGVFNINSRMMFIWVKSIILIEVISLIRKLGVPNSGLRRLYKLVFPTRLGKTLVLEGVVEHSLVDLGENCIIGHNSEVWGHLIEGNKLIIKKVKIGDNVTIGAKSIIMPGAVIGDNTIIGAMSLVPKNKVLEPNSVYVGVPVHKIKSIKP